MAAAAVVMVAVAVAPTVVRRTGWIQARWRSELVARGVDGRLDDVAIGWTTPLTIVGAEILGPNGTRVMVESVRTDADLRSLMSMMMTGRTRLSAEVDGVTVTSVVDGGRASVAEDLKCWKSSDRSETRSASSDRPSPELTVRCSDVNLRWVDADGRELASARGDGEATVRNQGVSATTGWVVTDNRGGVGRCRAWGETAGDRWRGGFETETLPLAAVDVATVGWVDHDVTLRSGDFTGTAELAGTLNDAPEVSLVTEGCRVDELDAVAPGGEHLLAATTTFRGRVDVAGAAGRRSIRSEASVFETDFCGGTFSGTVRPPTADRRTDPTAWLAAVHGSGEFDIDAAALQRAAGGWLPLRDDTRLVGGRIAATADIDPSVPDAPCRLTASVVDLTADTAAGRRTAEPIHVAAVVHNDGRHLRVDDLRLDAGFADLSGSGDVRGGRLAGRLDLTTFSRDWSDWFDGVPDDASGDAVIDANWFTAGGGGWSVEGEAAMNAVKLGDATPLSGRGRLRAGGQIDSMTLTRLDDLRLVWRDDAADAEVNLIRPVERPTADAAFPVDVRLSMPAGRLAGLASLDVGLAGNVAVEGEVRATVTGGVVRTATARWTDAAVIRDGDAATLGDCLASFDGGLDLADGSADVERFRWASDGVEIDAAGRYSPSDTDLGGRVVGDLDIVRRLASTDPPAVAGTVRGDWRYRGTDAPTEADLRCEDLFVETIGDIGPASAVAIWRPTPAGGDLRIEHCVAAGVEAAVNVDIDRSRTDWINGEADAAIDWGSVTPRLRAATGLRNLNVRGDHRCRWRFAVDDQGFRAAGDVGWTQAAVGGVPVGEASVGLSVTSTGVAFDDSTIAVSGGTLTPRGRVDWSRGRGRLTLDAGRLADGVRLTPAMTATWLKYLAPAAADAGTVDGVVGIDIDDAVVPLDRPADARLSGRLLVDGATMTSGPMIDPILQSVEQIRSMIRRDDAADRTATRLMRMPPQKIAFRMSDGVVSHDRATFEIDRASLVTDGHVRIDGGLDVMVQVPIDPRWVGRDLQSLAGRPLRVPVRGTVDAPRPDLRDVTALVAEGAVDAGRREVGRLIEKEIGRGLDRLFGR